MHLHINFLYPWSYEGVWSLQKKGKKGNLKNKDNLKNEDDPKNKEDIKNKDDLKNETYLRKEDTESAALH